MISTKQRPLTDRQTQLAVLAELAHEYPFKPAEIGVEVDDGVVTLTGTVSSHFKIDDASEVAAGVAGVRDVANNLTVELPSSTTPDDTRIAKAIRQALMGDAIVPAQRIQSIVRNGVAILKGNVDYSYQRESAIDAVRRVAGVTSIADHISIAPLAGVGREIFDEIRSALTRRFPLQAIELTVEDGNLILTGAVTNDRIRRAAEDVAWSTIGVKQVANKIAVVV